MGKIEVKYGNSVDKGLSRPGVFFFNSTMHQTIGFKDFGRWEKFREASRKTFGSVRPETVEKAVRAFEGYEWNNDLVLHVNQSPTFDRLAELAPKQKHKFLRVATAIVTNPIDSAVSAVASTLVGKLGRDYYSPSSHSASVFYDDKVQVMKQLAIAQDYDRSKHGILRMRLGLDGLIMAAGFAGLVPVGPLRDSWRGSREVLRRLPPEELKRANETLEHELIMDFAGGVKFVAGPVLAFLYKHSVKRLLKDSSLFFSKKKFQELLNASDEERQTASSILALAKGKEPEHPVDLKPGFESLLESVKVHPEIHSEPTLILSPIALAMVKQSVLDKQFHTPVTFTVAAIPVVGEIKDVFVGALALPQLPEVTSTTESQIGSLAAKTNLAEYFPEGQEQINKYTITAGQNKQGEISYTATMNEKPITLREATYLRVLPQLPLPQTEAFLDQLDSFAARITT